MDTTPLEVDRPTGTRGGGKNFAAELGALISTATTGKAIRFDLNGGNRNTLRNRLRSMAMTRGYQFHCHTQPDHLIVWVNKSA